MKVSKKKAYTHKIITMVPFFFYSDIFFYSDVNSLTIFFLYLILLQEALIVE